MAWTLPPGFEEISVRGNPRVRLIVAARARTALLSAGLDDPAALSCGPAVAEWVDGGRVRHPVLNAGGERWLLKAYHRGGMIARWNPDRYWGTLRFLRELETALRAVRAGVPAPEPIAIVLRSAGWGGAFRAWQVVRYVPSARTLKDYLERARDSSNGRSPDLGPIFRAAGDAVRRMHEAEIDHPDLHLGNILARPARLLEGGGVEEGASAFIIDWDRARLRPPGSWNPHRNLLRLWRSALKLALQLPEGSPDRRAVRSFLRGYFRGNRAGLRAFREYVRRRVTRLALHSLLWDLARIWRG